MIVLGITDPSEPGTEKCRVMTAIVEWMFQHNHVFGTPDHVSEAAPQVGGVVKLRGLPYSAGEPEIREFFSGLQVAPGGVIMCVSQGGRSMGEAYVHFLTEEDAKKVRHGLLIPVA